MKRARKAPEIPLIQLRLSDLVHTPRQPGRQLVNLKVPADILSRVHALAHKLQVTKTAALIALLNEGLQAAQKLRCG
jgi:hypothetical protein